MHQIRIRLGSAADPARELTAPPDSLDEFRGRRGLGKDLGRGKGTGKGGLGREGVGKRVGRERGKWNGKGKRDEGVGWAGEGSRWEKERRTICDGDFRPCF